MTREPIPLSLIELKSVLRRHLFRSWFRPPNSPTEAGFLFCNRGKSKVGGRNTIRVFARSGTYYLLTHGGAVCYEIGGSAESAASIVVECVREQRDLAMELPPDLVERLALRTVPLFEWRAIYDTSVSRLGIDDFDRLVRELAESVKSMPFGEYYEKLIDMFWLMNNFCAAKLAGHQDVGRWESLFQPVRQLWVTARARDLLDRFEHGWATARELAKWERQPPPPASEEPAR